MFKLSKISILVFLVCVLWNCSKKEEKKTETILKGKASIVVDETLAPIIEDQIAVFESYYDAKITIVAKSELEVINSLLNQENNIAVLTRELSENEKKVFEQKKIIPRTTKIAIDAIAFIANKNTKDTLIALNDVVSFIQGKSTEKIKGLVFDNPNSSSVRLLNTIAGIKTMRTNAVYSFKTNQEVLKFVAQNDGMIGVVGVNWLSQPSTSTQEYVDNITVLAVKALSGNGYFEPTQNNLAEGIYPLARDLFIVNCQGNSGLGMGFASFVAGDIGQRIILKSGLLPVTMPGRRLNIRKEIYNK